MSQLPSLKVLIICDHGIPTPRLHLSPPPSSIPSSFQPLAKKPPDPLPSDPRCNPARLIPSHSRRAPPPPRPAKKKKIKKKSKSRPHVSKHQAREDYVCNYITSLPPISPFLFYAFNPTHQRKRDTLNVKIPISEGVLVRSGGTGKMDRCRGRDRSSIKYRGEWYSLKTCIISFIKHISMKYSVVVVEKKTIHPQPPLPPP